MVVVRLGFTLLGRGFYLSGYEVVAGTGRNQSSSLLFTIRSRNYELSCARMGAVDVDG